MRKNIALTAALLASSLGDVSSLMTRKVKERTVNSRERAPLFVVQGGDPNVAAALERMASRRRRAKQTHPGKRGKRVHRYA